MCATTMSAPASASQRASCGSKAYGVVSRSSSCATRIISTSSLKLIPVSSSTWRKLPSITPTVGKFCTPEKPSSWSSRRKRGIERNGSVPLTPASTGVSRTTGSTSPAISTTIAFASP